MIVNPSCCATQRIALKDQVGGHYLGQAGYGDRLLVRARRRPTVGEHQRRLSLRRPAGSRQGRATLVVGLVRPAVERVPGSRKRRAGELDEIAARGDEENREYRGQQHATTAYAVHGRLGATGGVRADCLEVTPPFKAARCYQDVCNFRYAGDMSRLTASGGMRVLIVEDEPYMAEAIRDGLRLEAIAADIARDGDTALELLSINGYDIAVLDRDIPGPSGDEIAERIVASGSGMPILMLTAADRLDDKTTGFGLGADDYLTKPFELGELVLRLRALDRRRAHSRPPVREFAGLRLDPFRREVYRDGRYVALTRKQFAVLEVLVEAEGGVVSAEELLKRAWDENADPFTNAVRITVSALRQRLGEPAIIATVAGVGYRISAQ